MSLSRKKLDQPTNLNRCDDDTMPDDSVLRGVGPALAKGAERAGTSTGQYGAMRELVEAAGFINVQEKTLKCPIGPWAKHPLYKDAGHALKVSLKEGMNIFSKHLNEN